MKRRTTPRLGCALLPLAFLLWDATAASNAPPGHYTLTTNTALDNRTGLRWMRGFHTKGSSGALGFVDAAQGCQTLTLDSFSGWRLPTARELDSLYDPRHDSKARMIDETVFSFPATLGGQDFWSSTPVPGAPTSVEGRNYYPRSYNTTNRLPMSKTEDFGGARCVRGP
jgi:hypothetical protein